MRGRNRGDVCPLGAHSQLVAFEISLPGFASLYDIETPGLYQKLNDPEFLEFVKNQDVMQPPGTPMRWVAAMRDNIQEFMQAPTSDIPLKVISGDCDRTVDADWNLKAIKNKYPRADITVVPGVRHQVVNESEVLRKTIFAQALSWLNCFTTD